MNTTPVLIGITWFNLETRMKTYATIPLGFLPNLYFGKTKQYRRKTRDCIQDEHDCLTAVFQEIIDISKSPEGGFSMKVLDREVIAVTWIHFFIGDRKGGIRLVGASIDNGGLCRRPHPMCKCRNLDRTNFICRLVTLEEIQQVRDAANAEKTKGERLKK